MNNVDSIEEENKQVKTEIKNWWRWFWGTIIFLFISYVATLYLAEYGSKNYDINTTQGRENYSKKMFETLKQISPELEKYISNLSQQSKKDIQEKIHQEVSAAYKPVYNKGIKNFTEFHYSVSGEYIELYNAGSDGVRKYFKMEKKDNFDKLVYEMLFQSNDFDKHLKNAYTDINSFAINELVSNMNRLNVKLKTDLNITNEQSSFLVEKMLKIAHKDMKERFENEVSIGMHAGGLGSGAVIGAMASKQIAKMFAKKMATKAAVKTGSKLAGSAAGAVVGASEGLLCGPGAVLCSPIGAVIGGVVGWFATDKIVVEADKYFYADDFKQELRAMIQEQQKLTEEQLYKVYTNSIDTINKVNQDKLKEFRNMQNKEHI